MWEFNKSKSEIYPHKIKHWKECEQERVRANGWRCIEINKNYMHLLVTNFLRQMTWIEFSDENSQYSVFELICMYLDDG